GVKLGFPIITFPKTSPYVFINYVGRETRAKNCGYRAIRPNDKKIPMWEIYSYSFA
ncbi:uncharacterized protein K441DRAFT_554921, partial [Cenococcum geophilum 1.58]|uniref:uncharacterized protein n=1 Tax=Cenococcum geophilum 1.58 TaxID=794803 RepID=UPI00358F6268